LKPAENLIWNAPQGPHLATGQAMSRNFLVVDPEEGIDVLKGLASAARVKILKLLHIRGPLNVNDIAASLNLPQSTVSSNVQILEDAGLIRTETQKARKGNQKICHSTFDEVLVMFKEDTAPLRANTIEVAMPLGLYTRCEVSAPCGLCSRDGIIGLLDVPETFLDPDRMKAGLIWFTRGFVEYQFPNNAKLSKTELESMEFSLELSSEVPGTSADWPSDITLAVNGKDIGTWTSPGDFGDKRGVYTPDWWKLKGSQYGKLKSWRVGRDGTYVDGVKISPVSLKDLDVDTHHSIRLRIGVKEEARHPGGINIFGRGFGNYDQDIVLRLSTGH
jgi:predicted transcriptional regulator